MDNNLYRIERTAFSDLPTVDFAGILMTENGTSFVNIHPVKLTAKPKSERTKGSWTWMRLHEDDYETLVCSECLHAEGANLFYNYCPSCGAEMNNGVWYK